MTTDETREPVEEVLKDAAREPAADSLVTDQDPGTSPDLTDQPTKPKRKRYTTEERATRREERISKLSARLAKEKALKQSDVRKMRNSQLVALGVMFEANYKKTQKPEARARWREQASELVTGNTLSRVLAAFDRLEADLAKN